jgi:hypothetical protein
VLIASYRQETIRAFAIGFLVFGSGYGTFVLLVDAKQANGPGQETVLPTTRAIGWFYMQYHAKNTRMSAGGGMGGGFGGLKGPPPKPVAVPRYLYQHFYRVGQFVLTAVIGVVGGIMAQSLYITGPQRVPVPKN